MEKLTLAIIGAGNMGASLLGGLIADGYLPEKISVSDPSQEKLHYIEHQFKVNVTSENREAIESAEIIILAVKPQILAQVASELAQVVQQKKPLIISIAAGVRETSLATWLGHDIAIVRCMPNTPALIGCGASGLYANKNVSEKQRNIAESILRSVGLVTWVEDEKLMDVITALSGSGPAYFFLVMEILQQTAEKLGLPKQIAQLLTIQTAFGAASMALESEASLKTLREQVTSPGGTTASALESLEKNNIHSLFAEALIAAKKRSEELSILNDHTVEK